MEEKNPQNTSNARLPKSLTTVTTFSKSLALILFIALPFLGFYLGFNYASILDQSNQNSQTVIQKININLSSFKLKNETASPTPTCRPRPACLDAKPRCMIAQTSDMCPPITPVQ
jgi:hypothetical protein